MNKKSKTVNKTKLRRTKGRVYSLPEANRAIIDALSNLPFPETPLGIAGPLEKRVPESICDKARRLANEAEETKKKERAERELAFMKQMFETDDLAGAGVVMDKVREDGTIEYLICGRRWVYGEGFSHYEIYGKPIYSCYMTNCDKYLGHSLCDEGWRVQDLETFGRLLKHIDQCETKLRAKYPDNWWGRFKAKWA